MNSGGSTTSGNTRATEVGGKCKQKRSVAEHLAALSQRVNIKLPDPANPPHNPDSNFNFRSKLTIAYKSVIPHFPRFVRSTTESFKTFKCRNVFYHVR